MNPDIQRADGVCIIPQGITQHIKHQDVAQRHCCVKVQESRMRENLTYGLMRGHQRRGDGRLERDTRLKREKRFMLTSPKRYCAGVLLYEY